MPRDFPGGPVTKIPHSSVGGLGLIRELGHMLQLRALMPQLKKMPQPKILHATMKIEDPECRKDQCK